MSKQTKPAAVIVSKPALSAPVNKVVAAFNATEKAQAKLGDTVLAVAPSIPADDIATFCHMLKTKLDAANPEKAGSNKAQVSYVRRVLTAIIVDGVKVEAGQSLRGLYESLPKANTGGAAHGARLPNPGKETGDNVKTVTVSPAEKKALDKNAAVTLLFGTCNPELLAAVEYAASHSGVFMSWASASAKAAQIAEMEKLAAQKPAPVAKSAPAKRATRQRKAA